MLDLQCIFSVDVFIIHNCFDIQHHENIFNKTIIIILLRSDRSKHKVTIQGRFAKEIKITKQQISGGNHE